VAAMLLEKETITHDDVIDLIGPRPFKSDAQYDEFVSPRRTEEPKAEATATTDAAAQDDGTCKSWSSMSQAKEMQLQYICVVAFLCPAASLAIKF
jgi:hypothetical protein